MNHPLAAYEKVVGAPAIQQLQSLGDRLAGLRVTHINSTREGGGVAEILDWMVPLMCELGIDARWEVIQGTSDFFRGTKAIHNVLQGFPVVLKKSDWEIYQDVNLNNFQRLQPALEDSDLVIIHDPQPAPLLGLCRRRKGPWIWRAHIDISRPFQPVWKEIRPVVQPFNASIFSMAQFAQLLPHRQFIIAPSIDPLSEKNMDLSAQELEAVRSEFSLDPARPVLVQVSRFDKFKDPLGVIKAYRLVRKAMPLQLVLAGGGATDDPEGQEVLEEVFNNAEHDPDIHVHLLPANANRTVNALQRLADIVIQKSTREGFGLTVTEGLWKEKPVIGGDAGGIRLQVINYHTGFLVNTPEGAAHRIRYLLHHRDKMLAMGTAGHEFVRENFLLTRHLSNYLTLFLVVFRKNSDRTLFV